MSEAWVLATTGDEVAVPGLDQATRAHETGHQRLVLAERAATVHERRVEMATGRADDRVGGANGFDDDVADATDGVELLLRHDFFAAFPPRSAWSPAFAA